MNILHQISILLYVCASGLLSCPVHRTPEEPLDPEKQLDVVFIIDWSRSAIEQRELITFFKDVVRQLDLELHGQRGNVKAGVIHFSATPHVALSLNDVISDPKQVINILDTLQGKSGPEKTHKALMQATEMFKSYKRDGACRVAVVITDADSENKSATVEKAKELQQHAHKMCVVQFGEFEGIQMEDARAEAEALAGQRGEVLRNEANPDNLDPMVDATLGCIKIKECEEVDVTTAIETTTMTQEATSTTPEATTTMTTTTTTTTPPTTTTGEPESCDALFTANQDWSGSHAVWMILLDANGEAVSETRLRNDSDIEDLEVDPDAGDNCYIFYQSNAGDTIVRMNCDGSDAATIATLDTGSLSTIGMTIDRVNKVLFFLEMPGSSSSARISSVDYDGGNYRTAIDLTQNYAFIQDIFYDEVSGIMYWLNNNLEIWRGTVDGIIYERVLLDDITQYDSSASTTAGIEGLAFDSEGQEFFWTRDKDPKGIRASSMDGTSVRMVAEDNQQWMGITVLGQYVYAAHQSADYGDMIQYGAIIVAPKSGEQQTPKTITTSNINSPRGLTSASSPAFCRSDAV